MSGKTLTLTGNFPSGTTFALDGGLRTSPKLAFRTPGQVETVYVSDVQFDGVWLESLAKQVDKGLMTAVLDGVSLSADEIRALENTDVSEIEDKQVEFREVAVAPAAVPGKSVAYVLADKHLRVKDSSGSVSDLTAGVAGAVTAVTGTAPIASSGGLTPAISIPAAAGPATNGYMSGAQAQAVADAAARLLVIKAGSAQSQDLQLVAATATTRVFRALVAGTIERITAESDVVPAAGESMTVDILIGPASALTAAILLDAATSPAPNTPVAGAVNPAANAFVAGDLITIARTYVAGGGPAMTQTEVYSLVKFD